MEDEPSGRRNPSAAGNSHRAAADGQDGGLSPGGEAPTAPEHRGSEALDPRRSPGPGGGLLERRTSASNPLHRRHMPMEPLKFHIPRKNKEKRALFQYVSSESREFEDMMTILTSNYKDSSSSLCFTYSKPRLVHSAGLEGQFVEKRKEMKSESRTEKELEESHCFLLADAAKLPVLCEKGLHTGHSWVTALGNPSKGVYLSKFSDLIQNNPISPGLSGEIVIFKVMKGKVKSIYESMSKNLLDPTPRFDSHVSKNASKITSLTSYRAFELTQQYFYEYSFDEVRAQPRQVCPYAVVSYLFKGKDAPPPTKPLPLPRSNSQSAVVSKERAQFAVWNGALVKGEQHLLYLSLLSFSPPLLPCSLPEKLAIDWLMSLDHVMKLLPPSLFCWNLYTGSHEVVKNGWYCSLLEVLERRGSGPDTSRLLLQLEEGKLVVVCPLPDRGFLFLLSSVQMAKPHERRALWKRCLQALFVFPESRDMARPMSLGCPSSHHATGLGLPEAMLGHFVPALHYALLKARANPTPELSSGVERQTGLYLAGRRDRMVRPYPTPGYDPKLDDRVKLFPAPKHHRLNMESYLRSYLYSPVFYQLAVGHAQRQLELHPPPDEEEPEGAEPQPELGGAESVSEQATPLKVGKSSSLRDPRTAAAAAGGTGGTGGVGGQCEEAQRGRKRSLEGATDQAPKRMSQGAGSGAGASPAAESSPNPALDRSLSSVIGSGVLKDVDLRRDGPEAGTKLLNIMSGLNQHTETANQSAAEEEGLAARDRLAAKLGLPSNCDLDLRKHQKLEEQAGGSASSMEGFSPGSHSGESTPLGGGAQEERKGGGGDAEHVIPWVLIPITGVPGDKNSQRQTETPQGPCSSHTASSGGPNPGPPPSPELSIPAASPQPPPLGPPTTCYPNELQTGTIQVQLPHRDPCDPAGGASQTTDDVLPQPEANPHKPSPSSFPQHNQQVERGDHASLAKEEVEVEEGEVEEGEVVEGEVVMMETIDQEQAEEEEVSTPAGASPASPLSEDVDGIVEENLGLFTADVQHLLLKEEKVSCSSLPYTLATHPRLHPLSADPQDSAERTASIDHIHTAESRRWLAGFSQYVSFFSSSAPIQDFVCSLRDDMSSLLSESQAAVSDSSANACLANARLANDSGAETTVTLASSISDFLADARASTNNGSVRGESFGQNVASPPREAESAPSNGPGFSCPRLQPLSDCPSPPLPPRPWLGPTQPSWCPRQPPRLLGNSSCTSGSSPVDADDDRSQPAPVDGPCPDPVPVPDPVPEPDISLVQAPPSAAISSLISQLRPEMFNSLVEIIKDVKRNSVQFYVHSFEPEDLLFDQVREYLLSQGHVEGSPLTFLEQETPGERFLVVIRNKDISAHIHKVPGLVSLKRRSCVQFVGVDSLDDLRNGSYRELFVSGGCIISDEFVLNPHFITHERLDALLMFLEEQSSAEGVWRWKIHWKTHKILKQQARFKRDAASLLDVLSTYQKRLMVELLPFHHCDMTNSQSPDLDCLIQLQARYTQHRHLIFLTERRFEMFPKYSSSGIIIANMDDIIHNFNSLVGEQGIKDKSLTEDLPPQGVDPGGICRQPSQEDSALCPSPFTKPPAPSPPCPNDVLPLPSPPSRVPPLLLDQLVPDSCKTHSTSASSSCSSSNEALPPQSNEDYEALRFAISHFKATRAQKQRMQQGREAGGSGSPDPPGGPSRRTQPGLGMEADLAAATGASHSFPGTEGRGALEPGAGAGAVGEACPTAGGAPRPEGREEAVQGHNTLKVESSSVATDDSVEPVKSANEGPEGVCLRGPLHKAPALRTTPSPAETRGAPRQPGSLEPSSGRAEAPQQVSNKQGLIATPRLDHPSPHRASFNPYFQHQRFQTPQFPSGLLNCPPSMRFPHNPMLGPLAALGGMGHLLGAGGVVWPGGLFWNLQQAGRELNMPGLMGSFPNHGPPGQNQYRPGPRGGR